MIHNASKKKCRGELAEWSKAHDWKSCLRGTVTRVQIPNSPPKSPQIWGLFLFIVPFQVLSFLVKWALAKVFAMLVDAVAGVSTCPVNMLKTRRQQTCIIRKKQVG